MSVESVLAMPTPAGPIMTTKHHLDKRGTCGDPFATYSTAAVLQSQETCREMGKAGKWINIMNA